MTSPSNATNDVVANEAEEIVRGLPAEGLRLAVAYGSRYLERSYTSHLDMLVVVDSAVVSKWHSANLAANSHHYSGLARMCGANIISRLQSYGPGVYFNAMLPLPRPAPSPTVFFKYGVISTSQFFDDLTNWSTMYVAGRLQKPVHRVASLWEKMAPEDRSAFDRALEVNRTQALATSLLTMPQEFSASDLFQSLVKLSYEGDVRVENPNKVRNIVRAGNNLQTFLDLYTPQIELFAKAGLLERVNKQGEVLFKVRRLADIFRASADPGPNPSQQQLQRQDDLRKHLPIGVYDPAKLKSVGLEGLKRSVAQALQTKVKASSVAQMQKGIFSLGPIRSVQYAAKKIHKTITARIVG